jgi:hypothetical protein
MIQYIEEPQGYQPGVCNIGPAEIRRRQTAGIVGVGAAIGLGALLLILGASPATRLLVAAPLAVGFAGFLQARLHFCANYGWRGIRNLGEVGEVERVEDPDARRADRRKSLTIFGASTAAALALASVFALLPV